MLCLCHNSTPPKTLAPVFVIVVFLPAHVHVISASPHLCAVGARPRQVPCTSADHIQLLTCATSDLSMETTHDIARQTPLLRGLGGRTSEASRPPVPSPHFWRCCSRAASLISF
eukprot:8972-Eustigmatos_ZCMA.PRE.1